MSAAARRPDLSVDQQQLYDRIWPDGTTRPNKEVREALGWDSTTKYWAVRDSLIDLGLVFAGPGQGGTVRRANLSVDQHQLYDLVPADGSTATNAMIRTQLEWDDARYWAVRDSLIDLRLVLRGPGRGGTVRRTLTPTSAETVTLTVTAVDGSDLDFTVAADQVVVAAERAVRREHTLYDAMIEVLKHEWADDHRAHFLAVEMTARGGGRKTGGTWSRPDLVTVEVEARKYAPGKILNITTFEVKPADAINVQAVYEALAHRRSATHSYVLLHDPSTSQAMTDAVGEVCRVASSHGIGVITTGTDERDYSSWNELEQAQRREPDAESLEQFIDGQLSEEAQQSIVEALKR